MSACPLGDVLRGSPVGGGGAAAPQVGVGLPPQGACLCPAQDEELLGPHQAPSCKCRAAARRAQHHHQQPREDRQQKQKDIEVRAGRGWGRGWGATGSLLYSLLPRPPRCCTRV